MGPGRLTILDCIFQPGWGWGGGGGRGDLAPEGGGPGWSAQGLFGPPDLPFSPAQDVTEV